MIRHRDRSLPISKFKMYVWDTELSIDFVSGPQDNQFSSTQCGWRPSLNTAPAFSTHLPLFSLVSSVGSNCLIPLASSSWTGEIFSGLYASLRGTSEFRLRFADRYQKHFFNNGALTITHFKQVYDNIYAQAGPLYTALYGGVRFRLDLRTGGLRVGEAKAGLGFEVDSG